MADTIATGIKLDFSLVQQGLDTAIQQSRQLSRNFDEAVRKSLDLANIFTDLGKQLSARQFAEVARAIRGTAGEINRAIRQLESFENRLRKTLSTLQAQPIRPTATIREVERALDTVRKLKREFETFSIRERGGLPPELARLPSILGDLDRKIRAAQTAERGLIRQFEQANRQLDRFKAKWDNILKSLQAVPTQAGANRYLRTYLAEIKRAISQTERFKQELVSAFNVGPGAFQRTLKQTEAELAKLEVRLRTVRQAVLDTIRGRELSAISRAMATYPFSAHELAKPAEIITTTLTTQGIRPTLRAWWEASREIAAQEGRNAAFVFTRSFGQYAKQQFTRAFGAWLGAAFITFPIFYGTIEAVRSLNQAYNDLVEVSRYVQSATLHVGGQFEDLNRIMQDVIDLAVKTGVSFREAGKVLWEFRSAGFGAETARAGAEVALKLAQLGDVSDYGKAARIVAGVYRLFRDEVAGLADESERMKDIFGRVVFILNRSQISVDELLRSFEYFGSTAKAVGMDLNTMLAILSVLSDERLPGVGRAARQSMNQIAQAIPVLAAKYGIVLDANKTLAEQIPTVFSRLSKMFKDGTASLAEFALWMQEAGIRGGPAVLALARNWSLVEQRIKALSSATEQFGMSWSEVFDLITETRMDYFTKQWERFKNVLMGVIARGIHPLKQALADLLSVLTPVLEKLKYVNLGTIVGGAVGYAAGGPFGAAVGGLLGTAWKNLYDMMSKSDEITRGIREYDKAYMVGRKLSDWLFTFDLNKFERERQREAVKIAAILNNQIETVLRNVNVPQSRKEELFGKFLWKPEEILEYLKKGLLPEEFEEIVQKRLQQLAKAVNKPVSELQNLVNAGRDLNDILLESNRQLGDFIARLYAAASGRRGAQIAARNIREFGEAFIFSIKQIVAAQNQLEEALAKGDAKLAEQAQKLLRSALLGGQESFDNILNAISTFRRIYGEAFSIAAGYKKDPAEQLNAFFEKVSRFEQMQRVFQSGAGVLKEFKQQLYEIAEKVKDPRLHDALIALADSLGAFTKLDFSKAKSAAVEDFIESITDKARGFLPRSAVTTLRDQIAEVDRLLGILAKAKVPDKFKGDIKEAAEYLKQVKQTLQELIPLRIEELRLENKALELSLHKEQAVGKAAQLQVQAEQILLERQRQRLQIIREMKTASPDEVPILEERLRLIDAITRERLTKIVDYWAEAREKIVSVWESLPESLGDVIRRWISDLRVDLGDLIDVFKNAIAQIVGIWTTAFVRSVFFPMTIPGVLGLPGATPAVAGAQAGTQAANIIQSPGVSTLLTKGISGLRNYFMAPASAAGWLTYNLPYGPWTEPLAQLTSFLSGAPGAGLMAAATNLLFTGNVTRAATSGAGAALGWAVTGGNPLGALAGGIFGDVFGGVFGGKKKAPRVTFEADVEISYIPGKGLTVSDLDITTKRKYGAKKEYEQQVRQAIESYITEPINTLQSVFSDVVGDLPEEIRWRLEKEASDIIVHESFKQRTHKHLKGDIDARHFAELAVDLIDSYRSVFEEAFSEELKRGGELLTSISPYLRDDVKEWFIRQAKALFPEDVFSRLEGIRIEEIKGADFGKWLEENIKPLFDDIEAWEQFYDWAINYFSAVEDVISSINLYITSGLGSQVQQAIKNLENTQQRLVQLGIDPATVGETLVRNTVFQLQLAIAGALPDAVSSNDIYAEYFRQKYNDDVANALLKGIYEPALELLKDPVKNFDKIKSIADQLGISWQELLTDLGTFVEVAYKVAKDFERGLEQAAREFERSTLERIREQNREIASKIRDLARTYDSIGNLISRINESIAKLRGDETNIDALISGLKSITDYDKLVQQAQTVYQLTLDRYREEERNIDKIKRDIERINDLLPSFEDTIFAIFGQKPRVAERRYALLYQRALSGKPEDIREFLSYTKEYLEISKKTAHSSEEFADYQYKVLKDVINLRRVAENQEDILRDKLADLNKAQEVTINRLTHIREILAGAQPQILSQIQVLANKLDPLVSIDASLKQLLNKLKIPVKEEKKPAGGAVAWDANMLISRYGGTKVIAQTLVQIYEKQGESGVRQTLLQAARETGASLEDVYKAAGLSVQKEYGIDIRQYVRPLAEGGIVTAPTFTFLAEKGYPEAVIPLDRGNIFESLSEEVRKLREENKKLREDIVRLNYLIIKNTKRTSDTLEKWDKVGLPQ